MTDAKLAVDALEHLVKTMQSVDAIFGDDLNELYKLHARRAFSKLADALIDLKHHVKQEG